MSQSTFIPPKCGLKKFISNELLSLMDKVCIPTRGYDTFAKFEHCKRAKLQIRHNKKLQKMNEALNNLMNET